MYINNINHQRGNFRIELSSIYLLATTRTTVGYTKDRTWTLRSKMSGRKLIPENGCRPREQDAREASGDGRLNNCVVGWLKNAGLPNFGNTAHADELSLCFGWLACDFRAGGRSWRIFLRASDVFLEFGIRPPESNRYVGTWQWVLVDTTLQLKSTHLVTFLPVLFPEPLDVVESIISVSFKGGILDISIRTTDNSDRESSCARHLEGIITKDPVLVPSLGAIPGQITIYHCRAAAQMFFSRGIPPPLALALSYIYDGLALVDVIISAIEDNSICTIFLCAVDAPARSAMYTSFS